MEARRDRHHAAIVEASRHYTLVTDTSPPPKKLQTHSEPFQHPKLTPLKWRILLPAPTLASWTTSSRIKLNSWQTYPRDTSTSLHRPIGRTAARTWLHRKPTDSSPPSFQATFLEDPVPVPAA